MHLSRRRALGLLGSALALPYVIRSDRAAAASITLLGEPVQLDVGAEQPGSTTLTQLSPLRGENGFMAGWVNFRNDEKIFAFTRYFNGPGTALTSPIKIGGNNGPTDGTRAIQSGPLVLPDSTALTFVSVETDDAPTDIFDAYAQRFSAARSKVGTPQLVTGGPQWQDSILAVSMKAGNVLVVWRDTDGASGTANSRIRHRLISRTADALTPARRTTPTTSRGQFPTSLAALNNGNAALAYVVYGELDFASARVQLIDGDGARLGQPIILKQSKTFEDAYGGAAIAALPGGRALAVYVKPSATPDLEDLKLRIIEADGKAGAEQQVAEIEADRNVVYNPPFLAVEPGPQGRIVVMLDREVVGDNRPQLLVLDSNGVLLAGPTPLVEGTDVSTTGSSLIRMRNGVFVAAYTDFSGPQSIAYFRRLRIND